MAHSNVRIKVRRRKVANLRAKSKQFSQKNNCITTTNPSIVYYRCPWNSPTIYPSQDGSIVFEIDTRGMLFKVNPKPDKYGLHFERIEEKQWKHEKYPQPHNLRKRSRGIKPKYEKVGDKLMLVGMEKYDHPSEFKLHTEPKKMNHIEYLEKLVQHKLAKWERKNPKNGPLFEEDNAKWEVARLSVEEHLRDLVISKYDKLDLYVRHASNGTFAKEEPAAKIKDITGEGHNVTNLEPSSKLYKKAAKIISARAAKDKTITSGRLVSHNKRTGRIILPDLQYKQAA